MQDSGDVYQLSDCNFKDLENTIPFTEHNEFYIPEGSQWNAIIDGKRFNMTDLNKLKYDIGSRALPKPSTQDIIAMGRKVLRM